MPCLVSLFQFNKSKSQPRHEVKAKYHKSLTLILTTLVTVPVINNLTQVILLAYAPLVPGRVGKLGHHVNNY